MAPTRSSALPSQTKPFRFSLLPGKRSVAAPSVEGAPKARGRSAGGERRRGAERLTIKVLETLQPGDRVADTDIGGFYAERGARGVSLKVALDVARGKTVRRTLAQWRPGAVLDLRAVRADAARVLAEIRAGQVPAPTARRAPKPAATGELTVGQAVDRYVEDMTQRGCAPRTIELTGARLRTHLAAWAALPIVAVKPSDCQAAHKRITAGAGDVAANKALRDFRATWNLAVKQSDNPERFPHKCPVASVTMNREAAVRENAVITDLPGWWRRVEDLVNPLRAVMFKFGLLSGLRPGNLCGIRREWIDLTPGREVIRFPAAVMKGRAGKRRAFTLPLSKAMVALVREALTLGPKLMRVPPERCEWLFPTNSRDGRSVIATSNWTEPTLESNECGHALRHTYRTLSADAGVPFDVAEMLVAHTLPGVGARYVHAGELAARLRAAQEQVSAHIIKLMRSSDRLTPTGCPMTSSQDGLEGQLTISVTAKDVGSQQRPTW